MLVIVCQLGCNGQKKEEKVKSDNSKVMEKFDVIRFKENKSGDEYVYNENDTIVKLYETDECYMKQLSFKQKNFKYNFCYDKASSSLISEFSFFYKMPIGTWKEYDLKGNTIKSKNYDEGYPFTVDELILKLKSELNIDLNDNKENQFETTSLHRMFDKETHKNAYFINIRAGNEGSHRLIKIDGEDGQVLADKLASTVE